MRNLLSRVSMLAMLLAPIVPASAQSTAKVFEPSSAWALDYGDDYCRLMRDFSNGDETIGLFAERTQPGAILRLIVLGDSVKLFRGAQEIGYQLRPSGMPRMAPRLRSQTSDGQQYLNLGPLMLVDFAPPAPGAVPTMPPPYSRQAEVAQAAAVTSISLDSGLTNPVHIDTGPLGNAIAALQTCADDLVTSWGLDAEKHKTLTRVAMPAVPTAGWIAGDTIPFEDFAKLSGGNNELRVMIDAAGEATSCRVQWPTLSQTVNSRICAQVIENAQFMPALDQGGQAIDSYWTASVFFLMPPFGGF